MGANEKTCDPIETHHYPLWIIYCKESILISFDLFYFVHQMIGSVNSL